MLFIASKRDIARQINRDERNSKRQTTEREREYVCDRDLTVRELRITKFHKSKFRESRQTYERRKTEGQKEKPDGAKERSKKKSYQSPGALALAKFMVSSEAPITWEPLDMLGEKLSEEGTSHGKKLNLALQLSSIPVPHSTETHKHVICI